MQEENKIDNVSARTCVNVGVLLHVRLLVEPFATILAGIWPTI